MTVNTYSWHWFDDCVDEIFKLAGYSLSKMSDEKRKKFLAENKYFFDMLRIRAQRNNGVNFDIKFFYNCFSSHLTLV